MSTLRKLAGQTAIYGVSSILGRTMNFLLTPLYTHVFAPEAYGVVTELYAYVAFLLVLLTFGMETAFFRFGSQAENPAERSRVFSTAFLSVAGAALLFLILCTALATPLAQVLHYEGQEYYITIFAWIIALDVLVTVPLARLRLINKATAFAAVNLSSIFLTIALNLFFLLYCPYALSVEGAFLSEWIAAWYEPAFGVGYIFVANVLSSALRLLLLLPGLRTLRGFSQAQFRKLLAYAWPLLVLGLAGIVNETFDRAFYVPLSGLQPEAAKEELGIYGACYKVAMLLSIGIQAYRFAAEPFLFSMRKDASRDRTQALIMRYYIIVASFLVLALIAFLDQALLLIGEQYRVGAGVIPILLAAYLCYGILFNLSFWYKLRDKTIYGAWIALAGAAVTVVLNVLTVPVLGYYGAAWATLLAYACMAVLSYALARKHEQIQYPWKALLGYVLLAGALAYGSTLPQFEGLASMLPGVLVLAIFTVVVVYVERRRIRTQTYEN